MRYVVKWKQTKVYTRRGLPEKCSLSALQESDFVYPLLGTNTAYDSSNASRSVTSSFALA